MRKKIAAIVFIGLAFVAGWHYGQAGYKLEPGSAKQFLEFGRNNSPDTVNWQLLWDAISEINDKYVNRPADMKKVLEGAVAGAVASLGDPYSVFLPPQEAREFKDELAGNFEGIGAEIAIKNQVLTIVTPLDNSPAIKAGLKAGDIILKIDGVEAKPFSLEEAVTKIRGPAGTKVALTVLHKGANDLSEVSITRAKIEVKSVSIETKTANGKKIGYIKIRRFGEDTAGVIDRAVTDFLAAGVKGLIVDVRNDPGGFLDAAVEVASNWVSDKQTVVIQKFGDGTEQVYTGEGQARLSKMPTVVLMNGGSASASEILSGALNDHGYAKLIGEKSFGKGSVQELINLRDDAQLKLTIAKWLTPNGHDLNKDGLEPDIKVELTDEDYQADRDPQLDKALEEVAK